MGFALDKLAQSPAASSVATLIPREAFDPRNHAHDCGYHLDQYPWECSCGLVNRGR